MSNIRRAQSALIIFAREPQMGQVKTRLQPALSAQSVLKLYQAFIKDTLVISRRINGADRFIYFTGSRETPFLDQFAGEFTLVRQRGKNLGRRMYQAFLNCQRKDFEKMIMIGTDCLTVTVQDLELAFAKLDRFDLVLGPSRDGGYYLIGLNRNHPELFRRIPWSTSDVLQQTLDRAKAKGLAVTLLPSWYDIDRPEDLARLPARYGLGYNKTYLS